MPLHVACLVESLEPRMLLAADPSPIVDIPDPKLREAILDTLHRSSGDITEADMLSITKLDQPIWAN
jgi:hypothetical protein